MRIYHHIDTWECIPAGMYRSDCRIAIDDGREQYARFLSDFWRFTAALERVLREWPIACEQFLSNEHINRIAWLGQASMCIATGVPAKFRSGFMLLTPSEQSQANTVAAHYLALWERKACQRLVSAREPSDVPRPPRGIHQKVEWWIDWWGRRGYACGIPEIVPSYLSSKQFAPSYEAVAVAILSNDIALESLGFTPKPSPWYGILKRIELSER